VMSRCSTSMFLGVDLGSEDKAQPLWSRRFSHPQHSRASTPRAALWPWMPKFNVPGRAVPHARSRECCGRPNRTFARACALDVAPNIRGALMFSCVGRGERLFGSPNHDSDGFAKRIGPVALAGFFSNGEIGPVGDRSCLHGYTSVFAVFCEPSTPARGN